MTAIDHDGPFVTQTTEGRIGDWITTYTGIQFFPFDPRPEEIEPVDIGHALSLICRWTGHCPYHYSVAQHSVLMACMAERLGHGPTIQLACLLHDAAEAYINDMSRPMKRHESMAGYCEAERKILIAIEEKWGIFPTSRTVKALDEQMLATEAYAFFPAEVAKFRLRATGFPPEMINGKWSMVQWYECWMEGFWATLHGSHISSAYKL